MARYGSDQKPATRRRILDAAGARLKADGVDGSGIAALMGDAGLTNGAFYAHFSSKDDLVATVVADQLEHQRESLRGLRDAGALEQFVRSYLSAGHRDEPGDGCPSAALLPDIARGPAGVRRAYTAGTVGVADDLGALLVPDDPAAGRLLALQCLAVMSGTVQLARALDDRALSDALLEQGVATVLAIAEGPLRSR